MYLKTVLEKYSEKINDSMHFADCLPVSELNYRLRDAGLYKVASLLEQFANEIEELKVAIENDYVPIEDYNSDIEDYNSDIREKDNYIDELKEDIEKLENDIEENYIKLSCYMDLEHAYEELKKKVS